ncbi:MAG: hypothetical protein WC489_08895 [Patescibacteria group bacterium]|jgi:hypothetical protein
METTRIEYVNGHKVDVENLDEAVERLEHEYPDVVIDYDDNTWWSPQEYREGVKTGRMLVWENATDAENDDGANAVAEIIKEVR